MLYLSNSIKPENKYNNEESLSKTKMALYLASASVFNVPIQVMYLNVNTIYIPQIILTSSHDYPIKLCWLIFYRWFASSSIKTCDLFIIAADIWLKYCRYWVNTWENINKSIAYIISEGFLPRVHVVEEWLDYFDFRSLELSKYCSLNSIVVSELTSYNICVGDWSRYSHFS